MRDSRRGSHRLSYDTSNSEEGSVSSVEHAEYRADENDDEFVSASEFSRQTPGHHR